MTFFNQVLLARNVQGNLQRVLARSKQRLVVTFPNPIFPAIPLKQTTQFDIIESFVYKQSVRLTENPIEQGASINDHRIQEALELKLKVGVSNIIDPITAATLLDGAAILQASLLQIVGNQIANGRIAATFKQLKRAMQDSDIFDLDTPMGLIQNLVITNIENENNAESITTFEGTISMHEVLFFDNLNSANTALGGINAAAVVMQPVLSPFTLPTFNA